VISWESIGELFVQLELDLIRSFRRNLAKHEAWEKDEGFSWPAWQALKLRNMEEYRRENQKILGKAFPQIEADTMQLLKEQYAEGYGIAVEGRPEPRIDSDLPDGSFFGMNNKRLNRLIEDMTQGEKDVKTAALRMMDDVYRSTVAKAQLSMASGTKTLAQAVDMEAKDFLSKGINCIEFKDGRRMNIASYSEMALRTAATRAKLQGEAQRRKELGIDTVAISQYGQCSYTCLPWQGRVYVDDVFSDFEGERNVAGSFMLSRDGHWYRPLSHAVKAGLFHPNCRHTMTSWQRGINPMPEPMDFGPIEKAYKLEQKQRRMEREIRKWKRLAEGSQDPMNAAMYRKQVREAQKNLREFISQTNEAEGKEVLRRSPWREKTFGVPNQLQDNMQNLQVENTQKYGIIKQGDTAMNVDVEIDRFTPCLVEKDTGDIISTTYALATPKDLKELAKEGWLFNWRHRDLKNCEIYKLTVKNNEKIQGLVAIEESPQNFAYHLKLAESAPHNKGIHKHYEGVGGHLFVIAVQKSIEAGYGGFIYFEAKNMQLVKHYQEKFGATLMGMPHEYSMIIDEDAAENLINAYTLEE